MKDGSHVRLRHPSCVYITAQRQYTAGTYPALLRRTPSEPADFRPSQFSFLPQPDYMATGGPNDAGDVSLPSNAPTLAPQLSPSAAPQVQNQPAIPAQQNPPGAGIAMRGLSLV